MTASSLNLIQAIILGIVQGLTEFFPISSSAHLYLTKWLLSIPNKENLIQFDLSLHLGTLLSLAIFLRREIFSILKSKKEILLYFVALLPLIPAYFFLKPLRQIASDPKYLGYALITTGILLLFASRKEEKINQVGKKQAFWIGLSQSFALIPGISRSGSTIAMAKFCGLNWKNGAKFSFLLAIPTILGGELLESLKGEIGSDIATSCFIGGFLAAFTVGLLSVRLIFWVYEKEKIQPIAIYCLCIGLIACKLFGVDG